MDFRNGTRPASNLYGRAERLTPNDNEDLPRIWPALKIGATGGALVVTPADNVNGVLGKVTLNVAANETLPLAIKRLWATGTVATTIHGLG